MACGSRGVGRATADGPRARALDIRAHRPSNRTVLAQSVRPAGWNSRTAHTLTVFLLRGAPRTAIVVAAIVVRAVVRSTCGDALDVTAMTLPHCALATWAGGNPAHHAAHLHRAPRAHAPAAPLELAR